MTALTALGSRIIPAAPGMTARFLDDAAYVVVGWYPGGPSAEMGAPPRTGGPVVWDSKAQRVALAADVGDLDGVYVEGVRI